MSAIAFKDLPKKFGITPDPNGSTKAKTPKFRASYANVFEAKPTPSGDLKFSISMIFPKGEAKALKDVVQAMCNAAAKKFGADPTKWPKQFKCPMRDGDEEREGKEYKEAVFINAGSKNKPGIVDQHLNPIMTSEEFYSGCYARATVTFFPFDQAGNKGVGCGLNNLMKMDDGERLDGSTTAEDDFKDDAVDAAVAAGNDESAGGGNADGGTSGGASDEVF